MNIFRPTPRAPRAGDILKQMVLTHFVFKDAEHMAVLMRHLNNQALLRGIEQIFCICERGDPLLSSLKGFIHIDTAMHLYIKRLQQNVSISDKPVFISGLDL